MMLSSSISGNFSITHCHIHSVFLIIRSEARMVLSVPELLHRVRIIVYIVVIAMLWFCSIEGGRRRSAIHHSELIVLSRLLILRGLSVKRARSCIIHSMLGMVKIIFFQVGGVLSSSIVSLPWIVGH